MAAVGRRLIGKRTIRISPRGDFTGEVNPVKDLVAGKIGKLKASTAKVAKSVFGLETLRPEFDRLKIGVQKLQQRFARSDQESRRDQSLTESDNSPKPDR
jgi:hypothetical protein